MKVKCKYCGRPNGEENDLCLSCGAPLPIQAFHLPYENLDFSQLNQSGSYFLMMNGVVSKAEVRNFFIDYPLGDF